MFYLYNIVFVQHWLYMLLYVMNLFLQYHLILQIWRQKTENHLDQQEKFFGHKYYYLIDHLIYLFLPKKK